MPRAIALVAAAVSCSQEMVAEGSNRIPPERRQQCLYLRPDPQGQESFLPTLLGLFERLDMGRLRRWCVRCAEPTHGSEEVKRTPWIGREHEFRADHRQGVVVRKTDVLWTWHLEDAQRDTFFGRDCQIAEARCWFP